jgi:low affinity Fe/Cu permease
LKHLFAVFSNRCAILLGHPISFIVSLVLCISWAISGFHFKFSDTWQLYVNTPTTVLTFLALFVMQNAANRVGAATQAKLDVIIAALNTPNEFIRLEEKDEDEIEQQRIS